MRLSEQLFAYIPLPEGSNLPPKQKDEKNKWNNNDSYFTVLLLGIWHIPRDTKWIREESPRQNMDG